MSVYIVTYQLRKKKNYVGLFEQLEASPAWWHYLDSTWLVATQEDANQLCDRLAPHLDKEDSILVIQAGTEMQGWLPEDAWKWIMRNLLGLPVE